MLRHYLICAIAVVFAGGLAVSEGFAFFPVATCLLLFLLAFALPRAGKIGHLLYAVLLIAVLYGQYRYWHVDETDIGHFAGQEVTLTYRVAELPQTGHGRARFLAVAEQVTGNGRTLPVSGRVRISQRMPGGAPPPAYGARFRAQAKIRPITTLNNPGGFDYAAHMWRQGVRVRASVGMAVVPLPAPSGAVSGLMPAVHRWRARMAEAIRAALPEESAAFLTALSIGDARTVPEELRERFQASGLAHILAISGTHLGLVAGIVFLLIHKLMTALPETALLSLTRRITPKQAAGLCALAAVTGYALLAGGRVPTLRALVMVWVVTLALLSRRRSHGFTVLGAAGILILLWDPRAIGSASFQLSFAAVAAILLSLPKRDPEREDAPPPERSKLRRNLTDLVRVTMVAGLATAPLVAYHFGQAAWPGFFANLLLVPVLGLAVLPVGLSCAVISPLTGTLPLAGVLEGVLSAYLAAVGWFADLPAALSHLAPPGGGLVALTYAAALLLWLGRPHLHRRTAGGFAVLLLCWVAVTHPAPKAGVLSVAFLDVSQGDGAVITGPDGSVLVIDGGTRAGRFDTGRLAVAPYLWKHGHTRLSVLATHPQVDHAGGLTYLVRTLTPDHLYTNGGTRPTARFDTALHQAAAARGVPLTPLWRGRDFAPLPGVTTQVLHPAAPAPEGPAAADNNRSLVVRLTHGDHTFLFTGDIEQAAERQLVETGAPLSATVLKVPHHGSRTSSGSRFLERVGPKLAVVSAGPDNRYHHPHRTVMTRYQKRNVPVRVTATDGAVLMESDGATLRTATADALKLKRIAPWQTAPADEEKHNLRRWLFPHTLWRVAGQGEVGERRTF